MEGEWDDGVSNARTSSLLLYLSILAAAVLAAGCFVASFDVACLGGLVPNLPFFVLYWHGRRCSCMLSLFDGWGRWSLGIAAASLALMSNVPIILCRGNVATAGRTCVVDFSLLYSLSIPSFCYKYLRRCQL